MSLELIQNFLKSRLLSAVAEETRSKLSEWIDNLNPADDSDQLAYCIAVDIRSTSVGSELYGKVLMLLPDTYISPRLAFCEAVANFSESLKFKSRFTENGHDCQAYVNILDFESFLQSYMIPSYPWLTLDDREEAKHLFFGASSSQTLEEISRPWEGPEGLVWVSPVEDLELLFQHEDPHLQATALHDSLGLSEFTVSELIYVKYPHAVTPENCVQPTTFDAGWKRSGTCYLSLGGRTCWGKTHSRSGDKPGCRERIHGPIPQLSAEYCACLLGKPSIVKRNSDSLREEAFNRFCQYE